MMKKKKNLFFVSGTGRSGTHLIGRTISSHNEFSGRIEVPNTFGLTTKLATTQDFKSPFQTFLLKKLLKYRLKRILRSSNKHILEKSHPSLWLVEFLIKEFNTAKFIFVYRDLEPTVNSMLEHAGVLSWYEKLPQNKPNRFLGITPFNVNLFDENSIEEKCALRWISHYNEIFRLKKKYPYKTFIMKYDDFLINPNPIIEELSVFMGVSNTFNIERVRIDSLDKWKTTLDKNQLKRIREIRDCKDIKYSKLA